MIAKKYVNVPVFGNKPEDIEGYEDAINSSELYVPHHVLEWKYTVDELIAMNRYSQVDASELIWMTRQTHNGNAVLHKGHSVAFESSKGKRRTFSEEHRKKLSESCKGKQRSVETKKKMSESQKGRHWYNNGIVNTFAKSCPEGFVRGMLHG